MNLFTSSSASQHSNPKCTLSVVYLFQSGVDLTNSVANGFSQAPPCGLGASDARFSPINSSSYNLADLPLSGPLLAYPDA